MNFDPPLVQGILLRRYKRFLADVILENGDEITAHCPNTGSMMGVADAGQRVWLAHRPSPTRKYAYSWELTQLADGTLVGVDTHRSNALVREAIEGGAIAELQGYERIVPESRYGSENSRIDFLLGAASRPDCYVEVKNVTAAVEAGIALFPDAVSERGTKHLRELMGVVAEGARAVLVFCVQRDDVMEVRPADAIDPAYGQTLREALRAGVEAIAYRAVIDPVTIHLQHRLPVVCP